MCVREKECGCALWVYVGVNKSEGTEAHGSRSALKGCSQNRSCQHTWGTAHRPPTKKGSCPLAQRGNGLPRPKNPSNYSSNHGGQVRRRGWESRNGPSGCEPHLVCPWSYNGEGRRSPSSLGRARWKWCQSPRYVAAPQQEVVCPPGTDRNTCLHFLERDLSDKTAAKNRRQAHTLSLVWRPTCCTCQLLPTLGLTFADWLNGDWVGSDPGVVNLWRHHNVLTR